MVWTQEFQSFVWFDRPGESSPEKDCCWWHWPFLYWRRVTRLDEPGQTFVARLVMRL